MPCNERKEPESKSFTLPHFPTSPYELILFPYGQIMRLYFWLLLPIHCCSPERITLVLMSRIKPVPGCLRRWIGCSSSGVLFGFGKVSGPGCLSNLLCSRFCFCFFRWKCYLITIIFYEHPSKSFWIFSSLRILILVIDLIYYIKIPKNDDFGGSFLLHWNIPSLSPPHSSLTHSLTYSKRLSRDFQCPE